jgi:hypothetical protein
MASPEGTLLNISPTTYSTPTTHQTTSYSLLGLSIISIEHLIWNGFHVPGILSSKQDVVHDIPQVRTFHTGSLRHYMGQIEDDAMDVRVLLHNLPHQSPCAPSHIHQCLHVFEALVVADDGVYCHRRECHHAIIQCSAIPSIFSGYLPQFLQQHMIE